MTTWWRYVGADRGLELTPGFQPIDLADEELRAQVAVYVQQWADPRAALARLVDAETAVGIEDPEEALLEAVLAEFTGPGGQYAAGSGPLPDPIEARLVESGLDRVGGPADAGSEAVEVPLGETAEIQAEE